MPTSKTKELAKKLGLLKKRKAAESDGAAKKRRKGQLLSYMIVIDFESTCWKDKKGAQEIIEFPALLLDLSSSNVLSEFHHYIMPVENPRLSNFCKELTGITQEQVDSGIPLPTCLMLFRQWVQKLQEERSVCLMEPGREYGLDAPLCALATWTDWDLEVCLNYECRRKQIKKSPYFNQWTNLKALYKDFYDRRPSGLAGALEDLGIAFIGRQHSGLDDARNTAKLCYRMARDGCKLNITKCINKAHSVTIKPPTPQIASRSTPNLNSKNQQPASAKVDSTTSNDACPVTAKCAEKECQVKVETSDAHETEETLKEDRLDFVKVTIESTTVPATNTTVSQPTHTESSNSVSSTAERLQLELESSNTSSDAGWNVDDDFITGIAGELEKWENGANFNQETHTTVPSSVDPSHYRLNISCHGKQASAQFSSRSIPTSKASVHLSTLPGQCTTPCRPHCISHVEPITILRQSSGRHNENTNTGTYSVFNTKHQKITSTCNSTGPIGTNMHTRTSPDINELFSPHIQLDDSPINSPALQSDGHVHHQELQSSSKLKTPSLSDSVGQFRTPSTAEWMKVKRPQQTPNFSPTDPVTPMNGGKITPPLCNCGRRTKRKIVVSPGPNEGKPFYACPLGRRPGCGYFKWESASPQTTNSSCLECSPEILCPEYD